MSAKGKIVNTTGTGRHAPTRYGRLLRSGTFSAGRNAEKRAARKPGSHKRMHMLANRRLRQRGLAS